MRTILEYELDGLYFLKEDFEETEKAKNKFINLVGREFYDKLMILHEADVRAK